jgi:aprataxin
LNRKVHDEGDDIRVGIHAAPSMNHLHIHVISCDMHSVAMKHAKHYNSFQTEFFVELKDFPIPRSAQIIRQSHISDDLVCWRCGENFGRAFAKLKAHLDAEYVKWISTLASQPLT